MKKLIDIIEVNTDSTVLAICIFNFMEKFGEWNYVHDCWQPISGKIFHKLEVEIRENMQSGEKVEIKFLETIPEVKNIQADKVCKTLIIETLGFKYEPSNRRYTEITEW